MRILPRVFGIVCLLGSLYHTVSVQAQTEPFGATVLKVVTVTIVSRNYATRQAGLCHGAVFAVVGSAAVRSAAYITTAKHCVEALSSTPLESSVRWRDIREVVTVRYPNGSTGRATGLFWLQNYDALVMRATCCGLMSRRPVGWVNACQCGYYGDFGRCPHPDSFDVVGGRGRTSASRWVGTDRRDRSP